MLCRTGDTKGTGIFVLSLGRGVRAAMTGRDGKEISELCGRFPEAGKEIRELCGRCVSDGKEIRELCGSQVVLGKEKSDL